MGINAPLRGRAGKSEKDKAEWSHGSFLELVIFPLLPYLLWAICYYIKVHFLQKHASQGHLKKMTRLGIGDTPIVVTTEAAATLWNLDTSLVRSLASSSGCLRLS